MRKEEKQFIYDFSTTICNLTENKVYSNIIFLCVGTDRITGDTFGPIVGHKLKKLFLGIKNINIIGDLENTVCDSNIDKILQKINQEYSNPFIVAIDSALSCNEENVGKVIVTEGGIVLGKGLGKDKTYIGDMSIKGVVAKDFENIKQNLCILQNINLGFVMNMAETVANGIFDSIEIQD